MKTGRKNAPEKCVPVAAPSDETAESRFKEDLEIRGDAAELTSDGKLPPGATHAIVKKKDGTQDVKRGRFTLT